MQNKQTTEQIFRLNNKVISVKGNASKFLNGLTSNSLDQPVNAFLNIHGRIIATFNQMKINEDHMLMVVVADAVTELLHHIERYAKLNKTTIELTSWIVYFDLNSNASLETGDIVLNQKCGRLLITHRDLADTISEHDFTLFRVQQAIAVHMVDFRNTDMILNVHEHDYVSYTKGCFLGQEPVAKVHHRSKPTWKLVVKYADECNSEELQKMTSSVKNPDNGRIMGFVFVKNI